MKHSALVRKTRIPAAVIGFDSETLQGPPITFQFYSEDCRRINGCYFIKRRSAITSFLARLSKLPSGNYRMYGHNLEFDMLSVLWEVRAKIRDGNIDLKVGDWEIVGRYSKPIFCVFSDGKRRIELVDSFLWFMTSLERAGEVVCPDLPKLVRPKGLGLTLYTAQSKGFVPYAMRDAEIAYFLGKAVERFHEDFEVTSQISLASMAAAIFKKHYMKADIHQPPLYEWMVGSAASYHGGVNRVKPGAEMSWHKGVTALDLSSAYPHAWTDLPSFEDSNLYKQFKGKSTVKEVPRIGVYRVCGRTSKCDYPALFTHDFKPLVGSFRNVWVAGYELNEALRAHEVKIDAIKGFHYESKTDYSPFAAFAKDFYRMKSEAKEPIARHMHKITLNAPTGKLIQTSPDFTLVDGKLVRIRRAGGLYHPFGASLTTAHTRARIHEQEHKYEALHTATDGIFAPGRHTGDSRKSLGAVIAEGHGDLALFRNKLYIFYTDSAGNDAYPSQVFGGRFILKCARHGFQGRVADLERMLINPDRTYKVNKPIKLKTALNRRDTPNKFVTSVRNLHIGTEFKVVEHGKGTRKKALKG